MLKATKAYNFILLFLLFAILNATFFFVISDFYYVQRLQLPTIFNWNKFLVGTAIIALAIGTITFVKVRPFIYLFLVIILCVQLFPAVILYEYVHNDFRTVLSVLILISLIVFFSFIKFKTRSFKLREKEGFNLLIIVSLIGLIPFLIVYFPHIQLKNLLLIDIYETRGDVTLGVNNLYTTYTYQWFAKYIIPSLLIFSFLYKRKLVALASILAMIFLFLCGANKAVYFGILMVIIFSYGDHFSKAKYFILFLFLVCSFGLLAYIIFDYNELLRLSIRRLIFIPSILDILYFEFFDNNYLYWSENILSRWLKSPYNIYHSHLIGIEYFGTERMNANNGIFSDGFLNWGMAGVAINSIILSMSLSFISQLNVHSRFFGLYFLLFVAVISSSMTTVLITHGLIFLLIFSQIFLKDTERSLSEL